MLFERFGRPSMIRIALGVFAIVLGMGGVAEARMRCGWLVNPNASTWYLSDPQSNWIISDANGYEAEGIFIMGDLYSGEYRPINRYYGYACVCMDVQTNEENQITTIGSFKQITLAQCDANDNLTPPEETNNTHMN
jgi:hypothetical protein